ncbi:MAG: HAD family phosphatase [Cyclobacteriaceae bacterium]|jgi:beta-phosphoglucomutase|nr:HAD family phosphatase [Cyclobacteriaceae bacterium]
MSLQQVGVLFDMDGVLVDSNPYHKIALQEFCKRHQKFLSEEELIRKVYGRTNKDWITNLFGNISQETLTQYANEKEALFREIYEPHVKPVDGLTDFLNELIENKIPFTISTSAPSENVAFTLKALALENVFPIILDERFVNKGKPDPEIYIKSAAAIQLPTSQCWVI